MCISRICNMRLVIKLLIPYKNSGISAIQMVFLTMVWQIFLLFVYSCSGKHIESGAMKSAALDTFRPAQVMCAAGLSPTDSARYVKGGADRFLPTEIKASFLNEAVPEGMVYVPGGTFSMGSPNTMGISHGGNQEMADCRPIHRVQVDGFLMDQHEVTNAQFAAFVKATGYITLAEKVPTRRSFLMRCLTC